MAVVVAALPLRVLPRVVGQQAFLQVRALVPERGPPLAVRVQAVPSAPEESPPGPVGLAEQ